MFACSNALLAEGQRRSGGTGRRAGFKILSWQQGEGSTPSFGIRFKRVLPTFVSPFHSLFF
jgi:hypothetical protein